METTPERTLDCELCIVGAGYAALNGLNAAAKYMARGERVVVIDKNDTWGGQWVRQYDFVRLHQPYRMFTAGDQQWALRREPSYLATRREVLDHLASVPAVSAGHLQITPLFGHVYCGHRVRDGRAEIEAAPIANGEPLPSRVRIRAKRMLYATGTDIEILKPFPLSSPHVRSVAVSDPVLTAPEFLNGSDPVYVIGSGKTAMDCVRHVLQGGGSRRRPVHVLTGSGMWFFSRDKLYPSGRIPRYAGGGALTGDLFLRMVRLFDGTNEQECMRTLERDGVVVNVFGPGGNCRYGIISNAERAEIVAGVQEVHRGHLVDVEGTQMVLRDGKGRRAVPVPAGSWFVNCTSHLRWFPHQAVLQDGGVVCAPQYALGFTGTTAYYLTHLWYRDELPKIANDLYRLRIDVEPKLRFAPQMATMVMANFAMVTSHLPLSIASRFQGDFNKWYPLHRQIGVVARILGSRQEMLRKAERVLSIRFSDGPDPEPDSVASKADRVYASA